MRKLIFYGCIALGAGIGVVIGAVDGDVGLAVLLGLKLGLAGLVLGALLSSIGRRFSSAVETDSALEDQDEMERIARLGGQGMSPEEVSANYWRDKGHPPFMNPEDYDPKA
ncbi:hypothetical protein [Xanthomonas hortorum]|uniref:Uncharacterized protein n=1 Tax=Xanthomonas hortorum pv. hederae TaxID=453603 RepID=A0A9X3YZ32_9XANT|nr:hypothetical protein [Xanthomonas hortorum]MCE4369655.1 hypothetical protein [Xanthomonas hortorum pv. hederae]MDC8637153.1 hypothetical protein [Xanthomonas hortorum pv. hederae]PPU86198.1 hypothetical protein XhhCFBP4925_00245 [Xanthomonas hortorum pv. hederae]PUF01261.1 hypothetical protein C7T87_04210 [Xanthomonas hortorum pv. hederae]